MVLQEPSKGSKLQPRGAPFKKGNRQGKNKGELSDVEQAKIRNARKSVEEMPSPTAVDHDKKIVHQVNLSKKLGIYKDSKEDDVACQELVERLDFKNGDNNLSIQFSKRHNRMYRIQVVLNDCTEIRPVTYTGSSTGKTFWNLLKGSLKK